MRKYRRFDTRWFVVVLFLATSVFAIVFAQNNKRGGQMIDNIENNRAGSGNRKFLKDRQYEQNYRQLLLLRCQDDTNIMDNSLHGRRRYFTNLGLPNNQINSNSLKTLQQMIPSPSSTSIVTTANKNKSKKLYSPRAASVNSILRLDPSASLWGDATSICHDIPGLTREQMELCFKSPDSTKVALSGIKLATEECAFQMQKQRWNCSSLSGVSNPHSTQIFQKGYRETSLLHALTAAGIVYSVSKACSQGKLLSCGCGGFQYDDQVNYFPSKGTDYFFESNESALKRVKNSDSSTQWKWSGCSHNMDYGLRFSKFFLDSREKTMNDLPAMINLHNNKVGRQAVAANMEVRCKCHGLSGSCELRTCWKSAPDFRRVGSLLKNKFRRAVMIDQTDFGNRPLNRVQKMNKQRRKRRDRENRKKNTNIDLWYFERSPTFCESNRDFSIPGTSGRRCNRTSGRDPGSCYSLCCGRGHSTIRQVYSKRCNCQFLWCCEVVCQTCSVDEWITVCN